VLLAFADGEPVVVGVRRDVPSATAHQPPAKARTRAMPAVDEDEVEVIQAAERLELRCGDASLTLTKDGKLLVEGAYVSVDSGGVLRLRGASVDLD
jgi:hypothetical protein